LAAEWEFAHGGDAVRAVGFIADEAEEGVRVRVISGGDDAYLRSWSWTPPDPLDSQEPEDLQLEVFGMLDHPIYDLESSADGFKVVTGEGDWNGGPGSDTLRIWDPNDFLIEPEGSQAFPLVGTTAPIGFVYCLAISPYDLDIEGVWTVVSGFYGEIVVYDTSPSALALALPLEIYKTKKTKKKRTKALAFSPDGAILASTSTAGRIQLWSFPTLNSLPVSMTMSHGGSWVFPIAFGPYRESDNLTQIVSGSDGGTIKVWAIDLTNPTADVSVMPVASGAVYSLDWSTPPGVPAEDSMIVAGGDGDITVYDAGTMDILFRAVDAHTGRVNDVAFSPDGLMIVSGGADGELKLWDLAQ
jgi:WD40 repeat protein